MIPAKSFYSRLGNYFPPQVYSFGVLGLAVGICFLKRLLVESRRKEKILTRLQALSRAAAVPINDLT